LPLLYIGASDGAISSDGRFVAFRAITSTAGQGDVFVRDTCRGAAGCTPATTLVSVNSTGIGGGNFESLNPSLSSNGRFIAFTSGATNLVASDTTGPSATGYDIFVRDTCFGATGCTPNTVRVSVSGSGAQGNGPSDHAVIDANGHTVVFESAASNLVTGDTNGLIDAFLARTSF
jgi:Tol biopolymer transport system component